MRRAAVAETPYFFVYGSLLQRYKNFNRFLRKKVKTVQPAYCQGFLYHLPIGFPGLVTLDGCQDLVVGELMSFTNPVKIMRALDQLEGYYPDDSRKSVYIRQKLPIIVEVDAGKQEFEERQAWVYTYPMEHLTPEHQKEYLISCGNWKLLCQQPVLQNPGRIKSVFNKLRRIPDPKHIHIEPVMCMDEEMHTHWATSTACARFCKNPEWCRENRRKMRKNFM
ncbi:MAG: gamma-glutamylcyclotransferase family protein [Pseudomonadota bacterium]|nr:gamma-glutamylcyclotransferase family protein [Pseudomonadota bacterium]